MNYFHEEQKPGQMWTVVAIAAVALVLVVVLPQAAVLPIRVVLLLLITLVVLVVLLAARLVVDVDREQITIRFRVIWPTRRIAIRDVRRAYVLKYRPIIDYGGYGVRLGLKGWAYNVSGNHGVLVETKNGSRLMIGSQRPNELEAAIERAKGELEGHPVTPGRINAPRPGT